MEKKIISDINVLYTVDWIPDKEPWRYEIDYFSINVYNTLLD